jgi:cytochrome c-type biogenesis protein CcmF
VIALAGDLAVLTAAGGAAWLAVAGFRAARPGAPEAQLRTPVALLAGGAVAAFLILELGILSHDFTLQYVADHSSRSTPLVFLLAGAWAALEGSIVLWGLVLAGFTWVVARKVRRGDGLGAGALAVLGVVALFWFGMMATVANPFRVCTEVAGGACQASSWFPLAAATAPLDGLGPNPLLQNNILMAIHPPMLYLGFVGFTVPFAFAISALARGEQGRTWLERTHRWSLLAWTFLTLGVLLGAWWSYAVLGWGGYWAWDPVENAAFIPWLVATAFIHSAAVQRRRGVLQAWNLVLLISTFALTILGTFLTRSGTILSVHSFTQSGVGPALLGFLVLVLLASFGLFAWRADLIGSAPRLESLASREGAFLLNNLLLAVFAFTILVGTLYPILTEALSGDVVSVGRPFFDRITLPIALVLLLAIGVGSIAPYRVARAPVVWARIRTPLRLALVAGAVAVLVGVRSVPVVIVVVLSSFVIGVAVRRFWEQARAVRRSGVTAGRAMARVLGGDAGYWGGQIAHIGVALVALAIATSTGLATRAEVRLAEGDTAVVGGYCVEYLGSTTRTEPQRTVTETRVRLMRDDCRQEIAVMAPSVNEYRRPPAVASPAIHTGILEDTFLSLVGGSTGEIVLGVYIFPLQWLLWAGGLVAVGGGAFAYLGKRRRRTKDPARSREPSRA